jgi:hypothetical protein
MRINHLNGKVSVLGRRFRQLIVSSWEAVEMITIKQV